jgi:hypothetical protein
MVQFPSNARGLYGLRESLKGRGEAEMVTEVDRCLETAWAGEKGDSSLAGLSGPAIGPPSASPHAPRCPGCLQQGRRGRGISG